VSDEPVSRRVFFTGSAAALATAAAAVPTADAQPKASKVAAAYQWQPNGPQCCGGCAYFRLPHHCAIVRNDISPHGWCRFYRPRAAYSAYYYY
jgi:hypothetical protein